MMEKGGVFMQFRTDLTLEAAETAASLPEQDCKITVKQQHGITVTTHHIRTDTAAQQLHKPKGIYVTLELPPLSDDETKLLEGADALADALATTLPKTGTVLVVGLGNRAITPDALGPKAADMTLATRHIQGEFARSVGLSDLRATAVLCPGVLGQSGFESVEAVKGLCGVVHPAAVVAIDALAARSIERLGCTVQLTDSGIAPGAGVGNRRAALSRETLGIPVIGIGVPTVVDAAVIAGACVKNTADILLPPAAQTLMVTPKEIDLLVHRAARLIAAGLHKALHPAYSPLELISLAIG